MKRLSNWCVFIFNKYIPSSKRLVWMESKRLAMFIAENYDPALYPELLEGIRKELINRLKTESTNRLDNISDNQKEMEVIGDITNLLDDSIIKIKDR